MQAKVPIARIAMYLSGFHVSKDDPTMQMETHHYCNQANEDLAQCILFDGNSADARMIGVEYIISEKLYSTLPSEERAYWHPHNYEILSGQLRMPGLPDVAEKEASRFPNAKPVNGVTDNGDAATRPVPTFGMKNAEPNPSGR